MYKQTTTQAQGFAAFLELSAHYLGLNASRHRTSNSRDTCWPNPRRLTSPTPLGYPARERYLRCERHRRSDPQRV